MKKISDITKNFKIEKGTEKITNQRQLLIKDFLDRLNQERIGTEWKPLTAKAVAIKVAHLSDFDLKYFYKKCSDYKGSFGRAFFGCLKDK